MLVKRVLKKIYFYTDDSLVENQSEGIEAIKLGLAYPSYLVDIIIYTREDLKACYDHHIDGDSKYYKKDQIYSVLRKPNGKPAFVNAYDFNNKYKEIIMMEPIKKTKTGFEITFSFNRSKYGLFKFQNDINITPNKPIQGKLFCRDLTFLNPDKITKKQLKYFGLNPEEIREVIKEITKSKIPPFKIQIRSMCVISHSDIR